MIKVLIYISIFCAIGFISCDDTIDQPYPFSPDYSYIPLNEGHIWIDSVTEIIIDAPSGVFDTLHTIFRVTIDSIVQQGGNEAFIYCTKSRFNEVNSNWIFHKRFRYRRTNRQLIRDYDNQATLQLVFPLEVGVEWNPYAYSVFSDTSLRHTITSIDEPAMLNNHTFDSVMTVLHNQDSTLIEKTNEVSYYVKNKGLTYYTSTYILSDDPNFDYTLPIEERIKIGKFVTIKRNALNK